MDNDGDHSSSWCLTRLLSNVQPRNDPADARRHATAGVAIVLQPRVLHLKACFRRRRQTPPSSRHGVQRSARCARIYVRDCVHTSAFVTPPLSERSMMHMPLICAGSLVHGRTRPATRSQCGPRSTARRVAGCVGDARSATSRVKNPHRGVSRRKEKPW